MNCHLYDIAEIVSAGPHAAHLIGKRVILTKRMRRSDGVVCWRYVSILGGDLYTTDDRPIGYLEDHHLKAINAEVKERA